MAINKTPESTQLHPNNEGEVVERIYGIEALERRIEAAKEACEIETTPEVNEALEGYYRDHYALADIVKGALDNTLDATQMNDILESMQGTKVAEYFNETLDLAYDYGQIVEMASPRDAMGVLAQAVLNEQLADSETEKTRRKEQTMRCITGILEKTLFQEDALAITTVGESELRLVEGLVDDLRAQAVESGAFANQDGSLKWPSHSGNRMMQHTIKSSKEIVENINDMKADFWQDTRRAGQMVYHNTGHMDDISRNGSLMPRTEQYRRSGKLNAQTSPDRTTMHSVVPHFSEHFDPDTYKIDHQKEIGISRGTVGLPLIDIIKAAPYARDAHYGVARVKQSESLDKVPVNDNISRIGAGQDDVPGAGGGDRVFFSAPTELGDVQPDQYSIDLDRDSTLIFVGQEEVISSPSYGLGEGFPARLEVSDSSVAPEMIRNLQKEMLEKYGNQVIVPLRRGVFDFRPENMPVRTAGWRGVPKYATNPIAA